MINSSNLDVSFYQKYDSCALASYAIASNYFSNVSTESFFKGYCLHYNININKDIGIKFNNKLEAYEYFYAEHFQTEWTSKKCTGFDIISNLHSVSWQDSFAKARKKIKITKIPNCEFLKDVISEKLINNEILLIAAKRIDKYSVHVSIFGYDKKGFYNIETRPNLTQRINYMRDLADFGQMLDGILLERKEEDALDIWIDLFPHLLNDIEQSYNELLDYKDNLISKYPEIFSNVDLNEDNGWEMNIIKDSELQFRNRNFVRTFFSYVEGNIWCMSLMLIENGNANLSNEELSILREEKKCGLADRVKLVLKKFNINANIDLKLDQQEWLYFKEAIKIRDNITHPKNEDSIYLKNEDMDVMVKAEKWYRDVLNQLIGKWFN